MTPHGHDDMTSPPRPLFSVIVPCRDNADGLEQAIDSILASTEPDLEVIVVDDGSAVPVAEHPDPRVTIHWHDTSRGPAAARNTALQWARGQYIAFCDSDDTFTADRLALARTAHRSADIVVCNQGRRGDPAADRPARDAHRLLSSFTPHLGATTVRRDVCQRFDDRFLACQDIEWWIRTLQQEPLITCIADIGYLVGRDDRPRVLNSPAARLAFSYALLEQHRPFFANNCAAHAFRLRRIGVMERQESNTWASLRALLTSLRLRPSPRTAIYVMRTLRARIGSPAPPATIGDRPLPPLVRTRTSSVHPLRRGTAETRTAPPTTALSLAASLTAPLPRELRGPLRRAAALPHPAPVLEMTTAWGVFPVGPRETRLIAPYADEPLETQIVARLLKPGMTFIDVGANRGWYTLVASARVGTTGRVVAVEPDPRMETRLRSLIDRNGVHEIVTVAPVAVGGNTGTRALVVGAEPSLNHLALEATANGAGEAHVDVATMDFPSLCDEYAIDRVDVIKVDVEGLESEVLDSVLSHLPSLPSIPTLMFEYEPDHWRRAEAQLTDVSKRLGAHYDLYCADYRIGSLIELSRGVATAFRGRNVFAFPKDRPQVRTELHFDPTASRAVTVSTNAPAHVRDATRSAT